jgi:uncharacterized FAD-dependent dehydrogenase
MKKTNLKKWEKDICKAIINMYIAKGIELEEKNIRIGLEYEVSQIMNNMNCNHRTVIEEYLVSLMNK